MLKFEEIRKSRLTHDQRMSAFANHKLSELLVYDGNTGRYRLLRN